MNYIHRDKYGGSLIRGGIDTKTTIWLNLMKTAIWLNLMKTILWLNLMKPIPWLNLMKLYVFQIDGKVRVCGIILRFYTIILVNDIWCVSREHPAPQAIQGQCEQGE